MIAEIFRESYQRELKKLREEIVLYKNENDLWVLNGEIKNCAGNLALHLIGNLRHFMGAVLSGSGYVRNRDQEFSEKNISREKIIQDLDEVISLVSKTISDIPDEDMLKEYPIEFLGKNRTNMELFVFLFGHLTYHLGQINYHRRLIYS